MKRHSAQTVLIILFTLLALTLAALACRSENMRARDLPIWSCPTSTPRPTNTFPAGWELLTPPPATYTPYPSPTPYELTNDFPLGKHVRIGNVGGVGLGIWVWIDDVQVEGPFEIEDPASGTQITRWVASWDVTVENASLTQDYEFYPFAQVYVLEVKEPNGVTSLRGSWGISGEAHDAINLARLRLTEDITLIEPGEQQTVRVAAFIPTADVWRLGYVLDPLNTTEIDEMLANNSLGSNVGVWVNAYDDECVGEVTLSASSGTQPAPQPGEYLLVRHPVNGVNITRGFGCTEFFTGELGASCPSGEPWFHNGVDYAAATGMPYINPLGVNGTVAYAGEDTTGANCSTMVGAQPPKRGYGNYVKHTATVNGRNLQIWGAHLSSINTIPGTVTTPNDVLGFIGSTGCSSGSHLHFSVRVDGLYVDPLALIP